MPLLVVVVMFQVVLSGGIFPLHGKVGLEEASWLSPSRWGYAAAGATVNLNEVIPPTDAGAAVRLVRGPAGVPAVGSAVTAAKVAATKVAAARSGPTPTPAATATPAAVTPTASSSSSDPFWDHTARTWLTDMACLLALAIAFSLLTWRRLAKMGPVRRK
jgi:hypothetical protein